VFIKGVKNQKITARWGYSDNVPSDIELVATKLVAGIIEEQNADVTGNIEQEKIGNYSVSFKEIANRTEVEQILNKYRKPIL